MSPLFEQRFAFVFSHVLILWEHCGEIVATECKKVGENETQHDLWEILNSSELILG